MKTPVRFGALAGGATILYFLVFYLIDKALLFHPGIFWSSLAIYIVFIIQNNLLLRRYFEGNPPWNLLIQHGFIVFLIANAFYWLFYMAMFSLDSSLPAIQVEEEIRFFRESIEWLGDDISQADIDKTIQEIRSTEEKLAFRTILFRYAQGGLGGFLLALAIGFLIKRL